MLVLRPHAGPGNASTEAHRYSVFFAWPVGDCATQTDTDEEVIFWGVWMQHFRAWEAQQRPLAVAAE